MNTYDVCKKAHSGDKMNGRTLVYNNELTGLIGFGGNVNSFSCSELEDKLTNRFVIFANATPLKYGPVYWISADSGVYSDAAVQFTAADKSWLSCVSNATLKPTSHFVLCGWVWCDTTGTSQTIVAKGAIQTTNTTEYSLFREATGKITAAVGNGTTIKNVSTAATVTTGAWHFIAAWYDDTAKTWNLKIDTEATVSVEWTGGLHTSGASPFVVGGFIAGGVLYYPFSGRADSLMWFTPSSAAVIADIIAWAYNNGSGRLCAEITDAQKAAWGAVSGWELGESAGRRYDSWGSNHLDQQFGDIISPTVNNGGFETLGDGGADVFGAWCESASGSSTINDETAAPYAGDHAGRLDVDSDNSNVYVRTDQIFTVGKLYSHSCYAKAASGTPTMYVGSAGVTTHTLSTDYKQYSGTDRMASTRYLLFGRGNAPSNSIFIDNVTVRAAEILAAPGIVRGQAADSNFAVQLNGTGQDLNYTGTAFDPGTGDFSVGCAFYLDKLQTLGFATLISAGTEGVGSPDYWIFIRNDAKLSVEFNHTTGADVPLVYVSTGKLFAPGNWYTLVLIFDRDGNVTYSLNGAAAVSLGTIATRPDVCDPGNFFIGRYAGYASHFFPGRIDNAFYANRLLTADEIAYMHNNGKWRQYAEIAADQPSLASAMKGFWEFDNASNLGLDSTANGLNLTPTASPLRGPGVNYLEGVVGHWVDQSRNVIASQTTLSKRPAFISNALNGKPVIRFDGIDDVLGFTSSSLGTKNKTIIVVAKSPSNPSGIQGVLSNGTTNWYVGYDSTTIGKTSHAKTDTTQQTTDSSANFLSTTDFIIQVYRWNVVDETVEVSFFKNGILHGTTTYSSGVSSTVGSSWFIGAFNATSLFFPGDIAELMVFDRVLTDAQFRYIHTYLSTKYNL